MSEIAGRITRNIKAMHLDRVNWIAATLILNCERDIIRALELCPKVGDGLIRRL